MTRLRMVVGTVLALGTVAATATQAGSMVSATAAGSPFRLDGTVKISWQETTGPLHETGTAVYAVAGPLLTNAQRERYAPVVVPSGFRFRPSAPSEPYYLHAVLRSVSWTRIEPIEGCGDGSQTVTRTSVVERVVDPRAIFAQNPSLTVDWLRGRAKLEFGAIEMFKWQNGLPIGGLSAYSNLGEVFVRATGGCPEIVGAGPGSYRIQMDRLFGRAMPQIANLLTSGRKTGATTFAISGVNRSTDSPSPGERISIEVSVALQLHGDASSTGASCPYPTSLQLASATSVGAAQAILRRAGIPASFRGDVRNRYVPAGHFFVDTSGATSACGRPSLAQLARAIH